MMYIEVEIISLDQEKSIEASMFLEEKKKKKT